MKGLLCAAIFGLHSITAAAQVHRCTMPDGKTVYSDTACSNSAKDAKTLVKPATRESPTGTAYQGKIEFAGTPRTDYIKAGAILDNIRVLGRDCEWALKVDKKQISKCVDFLARLGPQGQFSQVTDHISRLNEDRANAEQNSGELGRILSCMEDIVRYKEFAIASLGAE